MSPQVCSLLFLLFLSSVKCHGYEDSWGSGYDRYRTPQDAMVDVVNNLALKLLAVHNEGNDNNIAISPYGALSVLVALKEGVRGHAADEIHRASGIPSDLSIIRIGLRDIHRHLKSYFIPEEGFLSGLTLSHDNVTLHREYEDILRFYGFDIDSFNNALDPELSTTEMPRTTTEIAEMLTATTGESSSMTEKLSEKELISTIPTTTEAVSTTTESDRTTRSEPPTTLDATKTSEIMSTTTEIPTTSTTPSASTSTMAPTDDKMTTLVTTETTTGANTDTTSVDKMTSEMKTDRNSESSTQVQSTTSESSTTEAVTEPSSTRTETVSTTEAISSTVQNTETSTELSSTATSEPSTEPISSTTSEDSTMQSTETSTESSTSSENTSTETSTENKEETSDASTTVGLTISTQSSDLNDTSETEPTSELPTTVPTNTVLLNDEIKNSDESKNNDALRRDTRSVVDYIIARYYDDHAITQRPPPYNSENDLYFLINGKYKESNINYMTYDTVLPFYYISHLNTLALRFPLDSSKYYLLLLLPDDPQQLNRLICDLRLNSSLKHITDNLRYTHVKAIIPSFMLKGYVVLTQTFQKMGITRVFEPRQADFSPMTDNRGLYVTNIEQAITVNIRNYVDLDTMNNNRYLHRSNPVLFRADHPFLYFVIDSQIDVTLMAGKITNPLNSRIR